MGDAIDFGHYPPSDIRAASVVVDAYLRQQLARIARDEPTRRYVEDTRRLIKRYREALAAGTADALEPVVVNPTTAVGRQRSTSGLLIERALGTSTYKWDDELEGAPAEFLKAEYARLADVILRAQTYLWHTDVWQSVAEMRTPEGATLDAEFLHVGESAWWTWRENMNVTFEGYDGGRLDNYQLAGWLVHRKDPASDWPEMDPQCDVAVYVIGFDVEHRDQIYVRRFGLSSKAPASEQSRPFINAAAFIRSPYVPVEDVLVERQARKRATIPCTLPVRTVALRKAQVGATRGASEVEVAREWSCRWIVTGHLRNQYYPSIGGHRTIYVPPFVKGPADKPLRAARPAVRVVGR